MSVATRRFNRWAARPAAPPSDAEAADAIAAFFARGGQVTLCPPAFAAPTTAVAR